MKKDSIGDGFHPERVSGSDEGVGRRRLAVGVRHQAVVFVRTAAAAALIVAGLVQSASSKPKATLTVTASPTSVGAGTLNSLTFTYTALETSNTTLRLVVPAVSSGAPWSAPQLTNQTQPGYVLVNRGSCISAQASSVSGSGSGTDPWTIEVDVKCPKDRSFSVVYGAGSASAAAATKAGPYAFASNSKVGLDFVPLPSQSVITVNPGAAARLDLSGLSDAQAGTVQSATVTASDAYGNIAPGYGGTVSFTSTDSKASLPEPLSFAGANGVVATTVTLKTAGSRQVVVTDATTPALTDSHTVVVSPGPAAAINILIPAVVNTGKWVALTGWLSFVGGNCFADVVDSFSNRTSISGGLEWTSTDPEAVLPGTGPVPFNPFCDFATVGTQTLTIASVDNPAVRGDLSFPVTGPEANPDSFTLLDPTHNGAEIYAIDVVENDAQTTTPPTLQPCFLLTQPPAGGCVHKQTIDPDTVTQAQTTKNGVLYQVGLVAVSDDGHFLVWDLNPPGDVEASIPGATLLRCPVTGDAICQISEAMEIEYGITDTVNVSTATVSLTLDTPDTPPLPLTSSIVVDTTSTGVQFFPTSENTNVGVPAYTTMAMTFTVDLSGTATGSFSVPVGADLVANGSLQANLPAGTPLGAPVSVSLTPPPALQGNLNLGYTLQEYTRTSIPAGTLRVGASTGNSRTPWFAFLISGCININTGQVVSCP